MSRLPVLPAVNDDPPAAATARSKMVYQLRRMADHLATAADDAAGEALLLHVDRDGAIHTVWMLDRREGRTLRMLGCLRLAEAQLLDTVTESTCGACAGEDDDDDDNGEN